jgi:putative tryptophan/tyrosine transport system substrate-binding protein
MKRRAFIAGLGGAAAWPAVARSQQKSSLRVVGVIVGSSAEASAELVTTFGKGLGEAGYVEGQNVLVEYYPLGGRYDGLPALIADLIRRRVAVIATLGTALTTSVKAATATIPIVFGIGEDPVKLGLVANLARPSSNATGVTFLTAEVTAKRLGLLHEMVPNAARIAALVNPTNGPAAETTLREVQEAAGAIGLQMHTLYASTSSEIDAAFATLALERPGALLVTPDTFFSSRLVQLATLAGRDRIPTAYAIRGFVDVGGLMSYGVDVAAEFHKVGTYTGQILKGAKPADLPVVQSANFEFAINMRTAKALGLTVPPNLLALADEVIE